MAESSYDLIVIGAGPGGYVAAIRAAQLGMRVACVDKDAALGGTCLNIGCIPSKALLDSSERFHQAKSELAEHGIGVGEPRLDLAKMMARKQKVVKTLTKGVAGLFRKNGVAAVRGTARLLSPSRVEVSGAETQVLEGARILIATGGAPIELPIAPFDGKRILSSTEALELEAVPRQLIVVGGGAIGLELGSVWRRLGAEVTVIEMLDRLVPGSDAELARALQRSLEKQGLKFLLGATLRGATARQDAVEATVEVGGEEHHLTAERLLVAVGRRPYSDGLGHQALGVATDQRGRIVVDEHFATNVAGVYAIGDVIAGPMLAHKAEEEGVAAVERMAGHAGHVNYAVIPSVVYTWPELASVGLSEEEAARRGLAVRCGSFPLLANGRARCMGATEGLVKLVAEKDSDRVVGVHILAAGASDLIAEAVVAMEFSASAEDLARTVHAHPTLAEAIKEAALAVDGRAIHV
jgi:dihydrolipoamide dehydrogenase